MTPLEMLYELRARTLCRRGYHCKPSKRIKKFDGGKCPALCKYCFLIVGRWEPEPRNHK